MGLVYISDFGRGKINQCSLAKQPDIYVTNMWPDVLAKVC